MNSDKPADPACFVIEEGELPDFVYHVCQSHLSEAVGRILRCNRVRTSRGKPLLGQEDLGRNTSLIHRICRSCFNNPFSNHVLAAATKPTLEAVGISTVM